ncbi:MAG TPA: C45 family autoproteolytic acyltransferase/hydrolase, partial [Pirellulales bacterium]|nr:C45 family autoproteolytic acyltransferase/hydrolase [Pirellulales bacterium]
DLRTLVKALFLRGYAAEYLHEMKGIADGAAAAGAKFDGRPIDLVDIVALNSEIEVDFLDSSLEATSTGLEGQRFRHPHEGQTSSEADEHCSAFAATGPATRDGQIVFGHITMFHLYSVRHFNVWMDIQPTAGHRVVFQTFPGGIMSGLDYYLNDAGLLCCETTIAQTHFNAAGEPLASRIRRVMQYADSIDKAVEILLSSNNGLYSNDWLLGDIKTNEIASFELGTHKHKLSRSSQHEFSGGTEGFYWGCNNMKDLGVRQETLPSLAGKPGNLVFRPRDRDVTWQQLFEKHRGKIDATFGFEAFTTPPVAAFRSCDAKFTTTALAKQLKSWARFGPPLGTTWDATPDEVKRYPDIKPLVSNDWTMLHVHPPQTMSANLARAVDLAPFPKEDPKAEPVSKAERPRVLPAAWNGTLLPAGDGDIWLAAAFSDYEKIVALEKSLRAKTSDGKLSKEDEDRVAVALFAPESRWQAATRRRGGDVPLAEVHREWKQHEWYDVASGKGVMLLAALRTQLGGEAFDKALDEFGRAHAGQHVAADDFRAHLEKTAGHSLASLFDSWMVGKGTLETPTGNFWSIDSFEAEPERALVVYGTLQDRQAQREAAELLARKIARRGSNVTVSVKADHEATDADLNEHHVLLVGRPACNAVTAKLAPGLSVRFGEASFTLRGEIYAHPDSAVVVAGNHALNPRYSVVVYAGLGARATRQCIENLPNRGGEPTEVLLMPVGRPAKSFRSPPAPAAIAMP